LKAGQGAASGLVASAALGNEVRPRSAARQGTAGRFGRHGDDGGASPSAWRGARVNGQGAAASGIRERAHSSGAGVSGEAWRQRAAAGAASAPQRCSSTSECSRAPSVRGVNAERGKGREKESRERKSESKC